MTALAIASRRGHAAAAAAGEPFLGVACSWRGRRWDGRLDAQGRNLALALAQREGMDEIVARIVAARGATLENGAALLAPRLRDLMPDPHTMTDCEAAADRLARAIEQRERVAVFGDYDVDGAASSALVATVLRGLGCEVEIYIPDRVTEGYGPNVPAIEALIERGAKLIVTVDCGTMSHEAIDAAARAGIDVVVIDHHQTGPDLPAAHAVVNPNRQDDLSGLGPLCATGVAFMLMVALRRRLARADFPDLLASLDLVALATVCDMAPLVPLNRAFATTGLMVMNRAQNVGLRALARASRVGGFVAAGDLGFLLGPRINAGGRVGDASLGARLLCETDEGRADEIAARLEGYNRERQQVEANVLRSAMEEAEAEFAGGRPPPIIITARDGWHPGVVGLVASRLKERFDRPAFAIGFDGSGRGSGSGRSVASLDLGRLVREAAAEGLLVKGGGHAMAAGLSLNRCQIEPFEAWLAKEIGDAVAEAARARSLTLDGVVSVGSVTRGFCDALAPAGPYGQGNPEPRFAIEGAYIRQPRVVGERHLAFTIADRMGTTARAIAFGCLGEPLGTLIQAAQDGQRVHLAGRIKPDDWRGGDAGQLHVEDAAFA